MTKLTIDNIMKTLADLDEQTMHLDPENPVDLNELHRIADLMDRLEDMVDRTFVEMNWPDPTDPLVNERLENMMEDMVATFRAQDMHQALRLMTKTATRK